MIDYDRFEKKLANDLIKAVPQKSSEYIKAFVAKVIETDAAFIDKETVKGYYTFCQMCGVCCEDCPELKDTICGIHNRRPEICALWPYWEVPGEAHGVQFDPDCPYAYKTIYMEVLKLLKR